jgi:soluble lytic murein transglycosylase-like protein
MARDKGIETMNDELIQMAKDTAAQNGLDAALVCAVCEQESGWIIYAVRMERAFFQKYEIPLHLADTESYTRALSWGLMQVMGQTAREFGFTGRFLSQLGDPQIGLTFGCKKLKHCLDISRGDVAMALTHYNGGAELSYPGEVMARIAKYQ